MRTITWDFSVAWGECDAAGIVFYPNFFRWMDEAAHRYLTSLGFPTDRLFAEGIGFPLLEVSMRFHSPLAFGQPVTLVTRCVEIRSKVFRLEHTIKSGARLAAEGVEVRAWTAMDKDRPLHAVAIPDAVRNAMHPEAD